jgi:hypothetical protein
MIKKNTPVHLTGAECLENLCNAIDWWAHMARADEAAKSLPWIERKLWEHLTDIKTAEAAYSDPALLPGYLALWVTFQGFAMRRLHKHSEEMAQRPLPPGVKTITIPINTVKP